MRVAGCDGGLGARWRRRVKGAAGSARNEQNAGGENCGIEFSGGRVCRRGRIGLASQEKLRGPAAEQRAATAGARRLGDWRSTLGVRAKSKTRCRGWALNNSRPNQNGPGQLTEPRQQIALSKPLFQYLYLYYLKKGNVFRDQTVRRSFVERFRRLPHAPKHVMGFIHASSFGGCLLASL
jgi:hypothetical protein